MTNLTVVIRDLENQRSRIATQLQLVERAVNALRRTNGRRGAKRVGAARVMSAAARRRIAAAQKARWAKWRKAQKAA